MKYINSIRKGVGAALTLIILLTSCDVPRPDPEESATLPSASEPTSIPEFWAEESTEQETPADMGSYITESTDPPVHFDIEAIRMDTEEAVRAVAGIYRSMDYHDGFELTFLPTEAELQSIAHTIGELGYPVVKDDMDMLNTDPVFRFWQQVENGESASLDLFVLEAYGYLSRLCFSAVDGKVYTTSVSIAFDADGNAKVPQITCEKLLDYFFLTDKGFLILGNEGTGWAGLAQGFRVKPLGQERRLLNQRYILPLGGFNGHNILVENWDSENIDTLNFNDVFEMLYEYEYGISPDTVYQKQYTRNNIPQVSSISRLFPALILKRS